MFLLKPLKTDYLLLRQVNDRSYELMNEILLLKLGELVLKGLNRKLFGLGAPILFQDVKTYSIHIMRFRQV